MPLPPHLLLSPATLSDIPSLQTIFARSFHPVNPYQKICIPDTPQTRNWWISSYQHTFSNPTCHDLVIHDTTTNNPDLSVIAVLRFQKFSAGEKGAGWWTSEVYAGGTGCDTEKCKGFIDPMVSWREKILGDRAHFFIQLFGTDHSYVGTGAGTALLAECCRMADSEGLEVFVQANSTARGFYERFGFQLRVEMALPGETKYVECFLVREPRAKGAES